MSTRQNGRDCITGEGRPFRLALPHANRAALLAASLVELPHMHPTVQQAPTLEGCYASLEVSPMAFCRRWGNSDQSRVHMEHGSDSTEVNVSEVMVLFKDLVSKLSKTRGVEV